VPSSDRDPSVVDEQRAWASPESLAYYQAHRQRADELYPSERFFLPGVLRQITSMLDVGCAAGGFSDVVRSFNPQVEYFGVDVVPAFVEAARTSHPEATFAVGDGLTFPTPPESFDLVHASGVLHLNRRYRDMVSAMWSQTRRFLLCDLRLTTGEPEIGRLDSPFNERDPVSLPYVVLSVTDALQMFSALFPQPDFIRIKGYPHEASTSATLRNPRVLMAFALVEKGAGDAPPAIEVDLGG